MIFANAVILSVSCWKEQQSHVALSRLADCPKLSLCLGIDIPETHLSSKTGQDFLSSSLISHVFSVFWLVLEAGSKKKKMKYGQKLASLTQLKLPTPLPQPVPE